MDGHKFSDPKINDFSHKEKDQRTMKFFCQITSIEVYKNPETLWNAAEAKENRQNPQTALEIVVVLPNEVEVTAADRIELIKSYVQKNYVDNGLAAQIAIHPPEQKD